MSTVYLVMWDDPYHADTWDVHGAYRTRESAETGMQEMADQVGAGCSPKLLGYFIKEVELR